ncbi:MAG: sigma-70 family RNA polymerase sigma factor [Chloroflexi bacterium]|nr:sigma-70 family RNA polymerase sigma factor [Chloroflexota bacterium]
MSQTSDRALVKQTRAGQTEAYGELVQRYQNTVFNVCYRLLGERRDAEDLTQEAFIRAFQRLASYDLERHFGPWIRRMAANLCYNHLKIAASPHHLLDEERDYPANTQKSSPEVERIYVENKEFLREVITSLPAHYRMAIELRHYQELSYAEISAELNLPLSDVKSHLFRARKQLAKRLKIHEFA